MSEEQTDRQVEENVNTLSDEAIELKAKTDSEFAKTLVEAKRKANQEAKDYRLLLENVSKMNGKDVDALRKEAEVFSMLEKKEANYSHLDPAQKAIAERLAKEGKLDAEEIGMPKQEISNKNEGAGMDNIDDKQAQEKPNIDPEIEAKLQAVDKLAEENRRLKTESLLRKYGANEDAMEDLLQLYKSPEIPENTSDEDAEKLIQEYMDSFKAQRAWGFKNESSSPVNTHNSKIAPPVGVKDALLHDAKKNKDISAGLAALRKG